MVVNSDLGANIDEGRSSNFGAKRKSFGPNAYTIKTIMDLMKRKTEKFDIYMDTQDSDDPFERAYSQREVKTHSDLSSQVFKVYNSKFGSGKKMMNPMGLINDGYFELLFLKNKIGRGQLNKLYEGA